MHSYTTATPHVGILTPGRARRRVTDALLLAALLCAGPSAADAAPQSLAAIERLAEEFVAARSAGGRAEADALDRRLVLAACDAPLAAYLRPGAQIGPRTVVGVRCPGSQPWKLYVPVSLVISQPVVVVRASLPRGHLLTAADLALEPRDVSRLPGGYLAAPAEALGQRLKQSLRAGSAITPSVLAARTLVRRGQTVILSAQLDAVAIRMNGKALMDGVMNQRIRVENLSSGRVVEGLVRSAERVEILVQ